MRYFKKENLSNKLYLKNGQWVQFQDIGGNTGLLVTGDPGLQAELDIAIQNGRGGVVSITEQEAEDLKKNPPRPRRLRNEFGGARPPLPSPPQRQPVVPLGGNAAAARAGIQPTLPPNPGSDTPLVVPKPSDFQAPRPPVGKRSGVIRRTTPDIPMPPIPGVIVNE